MPVLLITGAGRGIGAATARLAAARGYDVAVSYKTDAKSAADVVAAVKQQGRKAVAIKADMGSEADVERMFKEADTLGRLSHFVYNAGIPGTAGRLESAAPAMMREVIEVNVLGALWAAEAWGGYWSWDPKETWALIVWLNYAAWLHMRLMKGLRGTFAAWWSLVGLVVTTFAFLGVNMFLSGLHSYGQL